MNPLLVLVRASFLFAFAPAVAQLPVAEEQVPVTVPQDLTRLTAGEVLGNKDIHGLAIAGNRVCLVAAPEAFHSVHVLGTAAWTVNDLCVLKARAPGARDVLLTVGPEGLALASLTSGQTDPVLVPDIAPLMGGSWANASRVVASLAALPEGCVVQIAGLSNDQRTLLTGTWANGLFTPGPSLAFARTVRDLALVRWDADAVYELAVMTGGNSIQVRRFADLTTMAVSGPSAGAGFMTVLTRAIVDPQNPPPDEIGWARPSTQNPPTWDLVRGSAAGGGSVFQLSSPQAIEIADPDGEIATAFVLKGIAAGDFDADGNADVLAVPDTLPDWTILPQSSRTAPESLRVRQPNAPPLLAMPAVADFDHDGADDLLISLEELHKVHLSVGVLNAAPPPGDPADIMPGSAETAVYDTTLHTLAFELHDLPDPSVYNWIEITVWREFYAPPLLLQPLGIQPTPIDSQKTERVSGPDQVVHVALPSHATETSQTLFWQQKSDFWGRIRLIAVDPSGAIVKASHSYFFAGGLPDALPAGWTEWPSQYTPTEQLWAAVTRYGNLHDFGAKWFTTTSGRRIWTGVAVPTQGIPPTSGGGVPTF